MSIFTKHKSPGAFSGPLMCPRADCGSTAIRFVENVAPCRDRYRCRKCGMPFQYDYSAIAHPNVQAKRLIVPGS